VNNIEIASIDIDDMNHIDIDEYFIYRDEHCRDVLEALSEIFVKIRIFLQIHKYRTIDRILMLMPVDRVTPECAVGILRCTFAARADLSAWISALRWTQDVLMKEYGQERTRKILGHLEEPLALADFR